MLPYIQNNWEPHFPNLDFNDDDATLTDWWVSRWRKISKPAMAVCAGSVPDVAEAVLSTYAAGAEMGIRFRVRTLPGLGPSKMGAN